MTHAVRAVVDGQWMLCEPLARVTLGGVEYLGRALARMSPEDLAERGLECAETAGAAPVAGLGDPPTLTDVEGAPTWEWSPAGLLNFRAARISEVKEEAKRRIIAIMDLDQQRNTLARGQEMIYLHGPDPSGWPAEEQAEYAAIMQAWGKIKAIRAASNAIEAALPEDAEGLSAFSAADAEGWPA